MTAPLIVETAHPASHFLWLAAAIMLCLLALRLRLLWQVWLCTVLSALFALGGGWLLSRLLHPEGGLSSLWSLICGVVAAKVLCRIAKWNFAQTADAVAPSVMIATAIARSGCLWRGCDFGLPTRLPWGVRHVWGTPAFRWLYDQGWVSEFSRIGIPMHPFALYEAIPVFLLGAALWPVRRLRAGWVAWWCAVSYCAFRTLAEVFRAAPPRWLGVSAPLLLCIILLLVLLLLRPSRQPDHPAVDRPTESLF